MGFGSNFDVYLRNAEKRKIMEKTIPVEFSMKNGNITGLNGIWVGQYDWDYFDWFTLNGEKKTYNFYTNSYK